jgi:hypothetical protein
MVWKHPTVAMIDKLAKTFRPAGNPCGYVLETKRDQEPFTTIDTITIIPAHLFHTSHHLLASNG